MAGKQIAFIKNIGEKDLEGIIAIADNVRECKDHTEYTLQVEDIDARRIKTTGKTPTKIVQLKLPANSDKIQTFNLGSREDMQKLARAFIEYHSEDERLLYSLKSQYKRLTGEELPL